MPYIEMQSNQENFVSLDRVRRGMTGSKGWFLTSAVFSWAYPAVNTNGCRGSVTARVSDRHHPSDLLISNQRNLWKWILDLSFCKTGMFCPAMQLSWFAGDGGDLAVVDTSVEVWFQGRATFTERTAWPIGSTDPCPGSPTDLPKAGRTEPHGSEVY